MFRFPADVKIDPVWQRSGAIVERVDEEQHRERSPLLYDLTELQRHANRVFGMSAQQTLDAAQSLYEKKLLTYPRTDCRYCAGRCCCHASRGVGGAIERRYEALVGSGDLLQARCRRGSSMMRKVTDHHAILPTTRRADGCELTDNEERIYDLVCRRLLSCWLREYISAVTTVSDVDRGDCGQGPVDVQRDSRRAGRDGRFWKPAVRAKEPEAEPDENAALPSGLGRGVQSRVESVQIRKKKTRPPARFTEASLLTAMESAGRTLEEAELSEAMRERGLGTPATRAATIELLVTRGYVERRKKQLHSTQLGRDLIAAVAPELRSAELTGRWEAYLKGIERGLAVRRSFHGQHRGVCRNGRGCGEGSRCKPAFALRRIRAENAAAPTKERKRGGRKQPEARNDGLGRAAVSWSR